MPWSDTYGIKNGRFEIETTQTKFSNYISYGNNYMDFNLITSIKVIEKFK